MLIGAKDRKQAKLPPAEKRNKCIVLCQLSNSLLLCSKFTLCCCALYIYLDCLKISLPRGMMLNFVSRRHCRHIARSVYFLSFLVHAVLPSRSALILQGPNAPVSPSCSVLIPQCPHTGVLPSCNAGYCQSSWLLAVHGSQKSVTERFFEHGPWLVGWQSASGKAVSPNQLPTVAQSVCRSLGSFASSASTALQCLLCCSVSPIVWGKFFTGC